MQYVAILLALVGYVACQSMTLQQCQQQKQQMMNIMKNCMQGCVTSQCSSVASTSQQQQQQQQRPWGSVNNNDASRQCEETCMGKPAGSDSTRPSPPPMACMQLPAFQTCAQNCQSQAPSQQQMQQMFTSCYPLICQCKNLCPNAQQKDCTNIPQQMQMGPPGQGGPGGPGGPGGRPSGFPPMQNSGFNGVNNGK